MKDSAHNLLRDLFICSKTTLDRERKALLSCGVSLTDYLVLLSVYESRNRKMSDIAKELFVSRPVATYAVNRLVQKGLIKRFRSRDGDRRTVLLKVTSKVGCLLKLIHKKQNLLLKNSFDELPSRVRKLIFDFSPLIKAFSDE